MSETPQSGDSMIHMHIENVTIYHPHVQVKPEWYQEAALRHPQLAHRLRTTISWDYATFDDEMKTADVLVFMGLGLSTDNFAARAPKLRWIQMTSAGVEHIMPFDWLPGHVVVTNNRGVQAEKQGEFAFTAILMLNHAVPDMVTNQRSSRWKEVFGTPVRGKTVAVIGVGKIGTAVARHAKRMGMTVLGVRRSGRRRRYVDEMFRPGELHKVLPRADFVVAVLPHTAETRNLIGRDELALMKPGAGLVNVGRGATLDHVALAVMLESGRLRGAVLDAHDPEPLPASSPLWNTRNLIISPHCTSSDVDRYIPMTLDLTFENLERLLENRPLRNRVNKRLGY